MVKMLLFLPFLICLAGCTSPLGPKVWGVCLDSALAPEQAQEIRRAAIAKFESLGFFVDDHTDQFRALEKNDHLVFLRARDKRYLPSFSVQLLINPTFGGSNLGLYSTSDVRPFQIRGLMMMLEEQFGFQVRSVNDHGGCETNGD